MTDFTDRQLSDLDEDSLINLLTDSSLTPGYLARVASASVNIINRIKIEGILISLVRSHSSSLVREGCLQGLVNGRSEDAIKLISER